MCPLSQSSCCTLLTVMQWPPLTGTLVPHEGKSWQSECEKAIPEWAPFHLSNWLAMGHTSKANIPEISVFYPSCHHVVGQWITKGVWSCCRRGLLAYVYTGVSVLVTALVAGKWLLYTTAQWPWPSRSDSLYAVEMEMQIYIPLDKTNKRFTFNRS